MRFIQHAMGWGVKTIGSPLLYLFIIVVNHRGEYTIGGQSQPPCIVLRTRIHGLIIIGKI